MTIPPSATTAFPVGAVIWVCAIGTGIISTILGGLQNAVGACKAPGAVAGGNASVIPGTAANLATVTVSAGSRDGAPDILDFYYGTQKIFSLNSYGEPRVTAAALTYVAEIIYVLSGQSADAGRCCLRCWPYWPWSARTAARARRARLPPAARRPDHVGALHAAVRLDCGADTIDGLRHQTRPPDLIVVCANNCTDDTAAVARAGVDVIDMPRNPDRKAGALNYAMETILPSLADRDRIFVQDADTVCMPRWLELANDVMDGDPRAVVSGRYACKAEYGLIGMMQRNEFARECRMIDRRGDRTHILVGTSTLLPVAMLREVIAARRTGRLPPGTCTCPSR